MGRESGVGIFVFFVSDAVFFSFALDGVYGYSFLFLLLHRSRESEGL
jgi:hypothetical protein